MSGFAIEMLRGNAVAEMANAQRMQNALSVFGNDRRQAVATRSFAIAWVHGEGLTLHDAHERQPVSLEDRWLILFLGKLNHRGELAAKLGLSRAELQRTPDSKLVAMAWSKWRRDCRDHLYGRVSMVVCDLRERQVIAIRSPERSPALYYHISGDRIIIASSTKAIFAFPEIERQLDDAKIADLLVQNFDDAERSMFEGISVVPQSSTLTIGTAGEPGLDRHDFLSQVEDVRYPRDEDYVERARELLRDAVAETFNVPGSPALSLSGGLDSTCIAVAMIEHMREAGTASPGCLRAYVGVPEADWDRHQREGWQGDESGPVRALAAMYPELDPVFVDAREFGFDDAIDPIQNYADMPVRGVANSGLGAAIARRCKADGHSALVQGVSGNGTISFSAANILFSQWFRKGRWLNMLREMRQFAARRPDLGMRWAMGQAVTLSLPDPLYDAYQHARAPAKSTGMYRFSAIHPDFAEKVDVPGRLARFDRDVRYRTKPDRRHMMRVMMARGVRNYSGGFIEGSRAMTGLEMLDPLEDRKITEFCYAIPDDQFYRGGVDRRLVKRMMRGKLPQEVLSAARGEQASDWHLRMTRRLPALRNEIDAYRDIPQVAERIDLDRMAAIIDAWPETTPTCSETYPDYAIARYGIGRALAMARFINSVEGRNVNM